MAMKPLCCTQTQTGPDQRHINAPLFSTFHALSAFGHIIYSTVTDLARLRGWSISQPRAAAM